MLLTLDQEPAFETGSGADDGDEVGAVDGSPAGLSGLDEFGTRHPCRTN